jgi:hypothetical protein
MEEIQASLSPRKGLELLLSTKAVVLVLATWPPTKDLFLKLPRLELDPLPEAPIRDCIQNAATELGIRLKPRQVSNLMERCGGNPMLYEETDPNEVKTLEGIEKAVRGHMLETVEPELGHFLSAQAAAQPKVVSETSPASLAD